MDGTNEETQIVTDNEKRESDGRFALKIESKRSVKRWAKRDVEIAKRRDELGEDWAVFA